MARKGRHFQQKCERIALKCDSAWYSALELERGVGRGCGGGRLERQTGVHHGERARGQWKTSNRVTSIVVCKVVDMKPRKWS